MFLELIRKQVTRYVSRYENFLFLIFRTSWGHPNSFFQVKGQVSKETVVLRRWEYYKINRSDEGLTLETSASESLYGGQFTLSTQLIKPNYLSSKDGAGHQDKL